VRCCGFTRGRAAACQVVSEGYSPRRSPRGLSDAPLSPRLAAPSTAAYKGTARRGAVGTARSRPAQGRAVSEPPQEARSAGHPARGGALRSGALLFGYFLLGEQEKVTGRRAAPGIQDKPSPQATPFPPPHRTTSTPLPTPSPKTPAALPELTAISTNPFEFSYQNAPPEATSPKVRAQVSVRSHTRSC
jgi:hypothetical protein